MSRLMTFTGRALAFALPVALGVGAIMVAGQLKSAPEAKEMKRPPTPVRVVTLREVEVRPRVLGYGKVAPVREWRAIARVEGEVTETAPKLANGEVVARGTPLLRLDDTDLRLSLAQIDAQIGALDVKDVTLASSLKINEADLEVAQRELRRVEQLQTQGAASKTALDQARRTVLTSSSKVAEIMNQQALNTAERKVLQAQRAISARNLDFTVISAPYDIRIDSVNAEVGQVVTRGATLLTAEGTDAVEITAQFAMGRLGPIVRTLGGKPVTELGAEVRLNLPNHSVTWAAQVVRVAEAIDARTQSANIVVRVDDPLAQVKAGERPPLRRDMFVEVELAAPPRMALAVPADAVTGGRALVVAEGKLVPREVTVAYRLDGVAVVTEGLKAGDKLVVTDPSVAVPGMAVKPVEDSALAAEVKAAAAGGTGE